MATSRANNFWEVLANAGAAGLQGAGNALEKQEAKRRSDAMNLFSMAGQVAEQERAQEMHSLALTKAMLDNKIADKKLYDWVNPAEAMQKKAEGDLAYSNTMRQGWQQYDTSQLPPAPAGMTYTDLPPGIGLTELPKQQVSPTALNPNAIKDQYPGMELVGVTFDAQGRPSYRFKDPKKDAGASAGLNDVPEHVTVRLAEVNRSINRINDKYRNGITGAVRFTDDNDGRKAEAQANMLEFEATLLSGGLEEERARALVNSQAEATEEDKRTYLGIIDRVFKRNGN